MWYEWGKHGRTNRVDCKPTSPRGGNSHLVSTFRICHPDAVGVTCWAAGFSKRAVEGMISGVRTSPGASAIIVAIVEAWCPEEYLNNGDSRGGYVIMRTRHQTERNFVSNDNDGKDLEVTYP